MDHALSQRQIAKEIAFKLSHICENILKFENIGGNKQLISSMRETIMDAEEHLLPRTTSAREQPQIGDNEFPNTTMEEELDDLDSHEEKTIYINLDDLSKKYDNAKLQEEIKVIRKEVDEAIYKYSNDINPGC
jgi:hypothetical protein